MAFTATTEVVTSLKWQQVSKLFIEVIANTRTENGIVELTPKNETIMLDHYSYLLQITSWKYNINWEPQHNRVTVEVPNEWSVDSRDFDARINRDALTSKLIDVLKEVNVHRVLSHFTLGYE